MRECKNVCDIIVRNEFCVGCGVCAGLCPAHALKIEWNKNGEYNPVEISDRCDGCGLCLKICPFWNQNEDETTLAIREFGSCKSIKRNSIVGLFMDLFSGYSMVGEHRIKGASGGLTTWFLEKVLTCGIAKKICCVVPNNDPDTLFRYALVDSITDVRKASRSVYYPSELSHVIPQILGTNDKCVVVGLPCVLKALRLAMLHNTDLRKRIVLLVGLVCGQQKSKFFAEYLCSIKKGEPSRLVSASFRVKNASRHHLDHRFEFSYMSQGRVINDTIYQSEGMGRVWGLDYFKINACNFCDDVTSEVADVAFGDAVSESYSYGNTGANFVITRSCLTCEMLIDGALNKEIILDTVPLDAIVERQKGVLVLKRGDLQHRLYLMHYNNKVDYIPKKRFAPCLRLRASLNRNMQIRDKIRVASRNIYAEYRHQTSVVSKIEKEVGSILKNDWLWHIFSMFGV